MRIFGLPIPFTGERQKSLSPVADNRGWHTIFESFPGAWQRNITVDRDLVLSYHAVFACITLIASDIAKLRVRLVEQDSERIWTETTSPAFSPVLRKPNPYQTRIQFWEEWILSKLISGNTYVLKQRDARGLVTATYVLNHQRVTPLVSDDGSVFYQICSDNLVGVPQDIIVPARDIIHDRFNCLFHPLVGLSPIFADGLASIQGIRIQSQSANFFGNGARPSGVLTAPGEIEQATADRLKEYWETNFSSDKAGKIAVLGDGLKYEPMMMTSVDAQLIEQLKWTAEVVCSTFHVPPYKIGIGQMPTYNNIQALNVEYYSQCLQKLIEDAELCLDEGLGLSEVKDGRLLGTEFDLDGLLRMDSVTQFDVLEKAKSVMTLDERRKKLDLKGIIGGGTVYMQEQDHSIEAIAARDAMLIEQSKQPLQLPPANDPGPPETDETERAAAAIGRRFLEGLNAGRG